MESDAQSTATSATTVRRQHLWPRFAIGFLLVFIGMLLLFYMIAIDPSGQYAVRSPLWKYYADGIPRLFASSALGPASGNGPILLQTLLVHLLCSAGGGVAGVAIGSLVQRLRNRRAG